MSDPRDSKPTAVAKASTSRHAAAKPKPRTTGRAGSDVSAADNTLVAATPTAGMTATPMLSVRITVRWDDLDAFNHVNNATFLVYAQEARLAWLATIDGAWFDATMMPVVAAVQTNFRRQLPWPSSIVVDLAATRVGTSSLTIGHRIRDAIDASCVYADGEVVMVWINPADGCSVELPAAIRRACQLPEAESAATTSK